MILITGAGGTIGGHLVASFLKQGVRSIRAVDIKPLAQWKQLFPVVDNIESDLSLRENCYKACNGITEIYHLACNMGGIGFIENNKALCTLNTLIDTHMLLAARNCSVKKFFFASTACVYNTEKQKRATVTPLKEEDAYPALPEDGYGWQKLYSEQMCRHFSEDFGLETRIARFHNIYGPYCDWQGGREKAPAAICRKVAHAKLSGSNQIQIWGDGTRSRSFTYIDDCINGIALIMQGNYRQPINLGSSELVTINGLVDIAEEIAQLKLNRSFKLDAPQGVYGRNSDNSKIKQLFNWEPHTALSVGLKVTYDWIFDQLQGQLKNDEDLPQAVNE